METKQKTLVMHACVVLSIKKEGSFALAGLFPFLAPAAAPQNLSSTTLSDTAIRMQWEEVPEIDQNGEITLYEVRIDPARFQDASYENVSGSELMLVVDGLEEFVEYSFTVRAYTSVGTGPFSVVTTNTTDPAGESNVCVTHTQAWSIDPFLVSLLSHCP